MLSCCVTILYMLPLLSHPGRLACISLTLSVMSLLCSSAETSRVSPGRRPCSLQNHHCISESESDKATEGVIWKARDYANDSHITDASFVSMRLREADVAAPHAVLAFLAGRFVSLPPGRLQHVSDVMLRCEITISKQREWCTLQCFAWGASPRCIPYTQVCIACHPAGRACSFTHAKVPP